jgi:hypothetical protein
VKKATLATQKAICVFEYARTESIVTVQRLFRTKFGKDPPVRNSIKQWYEKFQRDGCLCIAKRPGASEETVDRVRESFQHSPLSPVTERV